MSVVMTAAEQAVREARIAVQAATETAAGLRSRLIDAEKTKAAAERTLADAESEFKRLKGGAA